MNTGWQPQIVLDEADARFSTMNDLCDARALSPQSRSCSEPHADRTSTTYMFQLVKLARIVNTTSLESKYLSFDNRKFDVENWETRYRAWYAALPAEATMNEGSSAHIIVMHLWYHGNLIQSFRPVFTHGLQEMVMAHRVCRDAADTISTLINHYQKLYGLRGFNVTICRALFDAYTIHLYHLPASFQNLQAIIDIFEELSTHQEWAKAWLEKLGYEARHSTGAAAGAVETLFKGKPPPLPPPPDVSEQGSSQDQIVTEAQEIVNDNVGQNGRDSQQHGVPIMLPRPTRRRYDYFFSPFASH